MTRRLHPLLLLCLLACVLVSFGPAQAALSADKAAAITEGIYRTYPVAATTHIYKGGMVMINASGYAIPAADTAACLFVGIAAQNVNNTGSAGAKTVVVQTLGECVETSSGLTQASLGAIVFATDDTTVATTSTNHVAVGYITYYASATSCRVRFFAPGYAGSSITVGTLTATDAATLASTLAVAGISSFAAGAAATPSITFSADPDTGFYRVGANELGLALGGTQYFDWAAGYFQGPAGSAAAPAISFTADPDTGFYRVGANEIGLALGGAQYFDWAAGYFQGPAGSAAAPSVSFTADPDSGIYRIGANEVGLALNGALVIDYKTTGPVVTGVIKQITAEGVGVFNTRHRVTTAEMNAGHTILTAVSGYKYRLIDCTVIAYGGSAAATANATGVAILGTQSGSVMLFQVDLAQLTRSALNRPGTASTHLLADGASFVQNDAATAITVAAVAGTDLITATGFDIEVTYALEP